MQYKKYFDTVFRFCHYKNLFLRQVHYATALDWFIICSFLYCVATILEFAGVHYFTKVPRL